MTAPAPSSTDASAPAPALPDGMTTSGAATQLAGRDGSVHTIAHTGAPTGSRANTCHRCGYSVYDTFIDGVRVPGVFYFVVGQPHDTGAEIDWRDVPVPEWVRAVVQLPESRVELCIGCLLEVFGLYPDGPRRGEFEQRVLEQVAVEQRYGRQPDGTPGPDAARPHSHRMREERERAIAWLEFQIGGAWQVGASPRRAKPVPSPEALALVAQREVSASAPRQEVPREAVAAPPAP